MTYIHGLQQPTSNLPMFQQSTQTTKLIIQKATERCFQKKAVSPTTQGSDYLIYSFIWQSSEMVWVGRCFFWYRSTRVVPDQRPLNGCVCLMKCNDSSCSNNNRCLQCFDAVGWAWEERPACKNWLMRCWCGYLSAARCRLFAYGPADAIAIPKPHHLLPHLNPDWFYLSGTGLPRLAMEKTPLSGCSSNSSSNSTENKRDGL